MKKLDVFLFLALGSTVVFWASAFAGIRVGLQSYSPFALALLRFLVCSALLVVSTRITSMRLPELRDLPHILVTGWFGVSIYHIALNYGEITVPAGTASLLINAAPIFTVLLAALFLKERPRWWGWIGIGMSFSGVVVITLGQRNGQGLDPRVVFVLLAALAQSLYLVYQKPLLKKYSVLELTTYVIWAGTCCLLLFLPNLIMEIQGASLSATVAAIYLGIFPSALGYVTLAYALSRLHASKVASYLYFIPMVSIIIAWLWLGEVPTLLTLVGGSIVFSGIVLVNWGPDIFPWQNPH